jgi:hypothetical protein
MCMKRGDAVWCEGWSGVADDFSYDTEFRGKRPHNGNIPNKILIT